MTEKRFGPAEGVHLIEVSVKRELTVIELSLITCGPWIPDLIEMELITVQSACSY